MAFNTTTEAALLGDLLATSGSLVRNNSGLVVGFLTVAYISALQYIQARKRDVDVPVIGPPGRISSYIGAFRFLKHAREMLEEGYRRGYTTFKLPQFNHWLVVVNTPELIEEVRRAPDDKLSFIEATQDGLASKYTLGPYVHGNHYHVSIVRSQLTRSLSTLYDDILDEVVQSFQDNIPSKPGEWVALNAQDTVMQIVVRTSNRLFLGLPLCRNKDFLDLNIRFTLDVIKASVIINLFPDFLKGFVGEFLTSVPQSTRRALNHLRPILEYRFEQIDKYGKDYPGKPNDLLSWLLDEAPENERRNVKALTQRILTLNFAAVHTSSISFTHTLLRLASRPEDIIPLREEVEHIVRAEGWSKASLDKMRKIDSYVREALRIDGIGMLALTRKVLQDYTLSDGTFLPAGTRVSANQVSVHNNDKNYDHAREFDGFRFVRSSLSDCSGEMGAGISATEEEREKKFEQTKNDVKNRTVATNNEFLTFGHGRHACPGRFFAANELKTMLAHLVLNYDVKLEDEDARRKYKPVDFATTTMPDSKIRVMFRKREMTAGLGAAS